VIYFQLARECTAIYLSKYINNSHDSRPFTMFRTTTLGINTVQNLVKTATKTTFNADSLHSITTIRIDARHVAWRSEWIYRTHRGPLQAPVITMAVGRPKKPKSISKPD